MGVCVGDGSWVNVAVDDGRGDLVNVGDAGGSIEDDCSNLQLDKIIIVHRNKNITIFLPRKPSLIVIFDGLVKNYNTV